MKPTDAEKEPYTIHANGVVLGEEDRQLVILSLALCALQRPGFDHALELIAAKYDGVVMYSEFKRVNARL